MSNFQCPECGMINIDCGKEGYKTPREIELEKENEKYKSFLEWMLKQQYYILPANIKKKIKEVLKENLLKIANIKKK